MAAANLRVAPLRQLALGLQRFVALILQGDDPVVDRGDIGAELFERLACGLAAGGIDGLGLELRDGVGGVLGVLLLPVGMLAQPHRDLVEHREIGPRFREADETRDDARRARRRDCWRDRIWCRSRLPTDT